MQPWQHSVPTAAPVDIVFKPVWKETAQQTRLVSKIIVDYGLPTIV